MIKFFKTPKAVLLAFLLAAFLSWYSQSFALLLKKPGEMYLSLLQMSVMPLLMLSLINAIPRVIGTKTDDNTAKNFVIKYTLVAFAVVLVSMFLAEILKTGNPIADNPDFLKLGSSGENSQPIFVTIDDPLEKTQSIIDLFSSIVTNNIFVSLQESLILQVILFSVLVGSAAGFLEGEKKKVFMSFIEAGEQIFKKLISWITAFLPVGIVCIFSYKFLNFSLDIFSIFFVTILCLISAMVIIVLILNIFIARKLNISYFSVFSSIKNVLIVAASTGSSIASMPTYMKALEDMNFKKEKVGIFIPLSIALYRFGNLFYFGFVATVIAQIFAIPLGFYEYLNILVLVFFAGFGAVSSGIVNIGMLSMILAPVGVPSSLAITLFAAIDPVIDPLRTTFTMYINLFCASLSISDDNKAEKAPKKAKKEENNDA